MRKRSFGVLLAVVSSLGIGGGCLQNLVIGGAEGGAGGGGTAGSTSESSTPSSGATSGGSTSGGGAPGGGGEGGGGGSSDCPSTHGPAMVRVPAPGGASYCIDTTEVTQAQYNAFLASNPQPDTSSPYCGYKSTFVPGHEPGDINQLENATTECHPSHDLFDPTGTPHLPVVCVDWCEASAYCAWAGKRLCGHIGGGPSTALDVFQDTGEWFHACTSAGASLFPYGASFVQGECNDSATTKPVESFSHCHGQGAPFDQIFDMSGNVAEWDSFCQEIGGSEPGPDGGPSLPACALRGGAANDLQTDPISHWRYACAPQNGGQPFDSINFQRPFTGIRCCAD